MRVLYANIEDVMREASARWTLVAYFFLSTIFILIFASAVNLDIVNGTLAGAKLFGHQVHNASESHRSVINMDELVVGFDKVFGTALFAFCAFLSVFATAHLVPRMQEKGTIDLYLSRPVGRIKLLFSRYLAGLILAGTNVVYLFGSIGLIVLWKTHVFHARFFIAGAITFFLIAAFLAFAFLIGSFTSSTAVSIMSTYAIAFFSLLLYFHDHFTAAFSSVLSVWAIDGLYWILPKTVEIGQAVFVYISGDTETSSTLMRALSPAPFVSTAVFAAGCLILASWLFQRKEF